MINRLKECREKVGLTQEQLGQELGGLKKSTISGWETNYSDIPLPKLIEISNNHGFSIDYILCLSNDNIKYKKLDNLDLKEVGKRLKALRKQNHVTQEDASAIAGIASGSLSRYERGVRCITGISLYCLCKHYNSSIDEILGKERINT